MTDEQTCGRCDNPTRDAAYTCDACTEEFDVALGDCPWITDELETTITGAKGVDYRRAGGSKGPKRDAERPSPVAWGPAEARTHLRALLVSWVLFCSSEHIRRNGGTDEIPDDTIPEMSRWLMCRTAGLALHDIGPEAVDEITSAVAHCRRVIDRPADRQYLGTCTMCETGNLYARGGSKWARCDDCGIGIDADTIRTRLLDELDDRLCTAAEIARLTTHLGLKAKRDTVRNRINQWHKREIISREPAFGDSPVFRFGIVWRLLMADEASRERKAG